MKGREDDDMRKLRIAISSIVLGLAIATIAPSTPILGANGADMVKAQSGVKLSKKSVTLYSGQKKKIKIRGGVAWRIKVSNHKIVKIKKRKKNSFIVKAGNAGTTTVKVKVSGVKKPLRLKVHVLLQIDPNKKIENGVLSRMVSSSNKKKLYIRYYGYKATVWGWGEFYSGKGEDNQPLKYFPKRTYNITKNATYYEGGGGPVVKYRNWINRYKHGGEEFDDLNWIYVEFKNGEITSIGCTN